MKFQKPLFCQSRRPSSVACNKITGNRHGQFRFRTKMSGHIQDQLPNSSNPFHSPNLKKLFKNLFRQHNWNIFLTQTLHSNFNLNFKSNCICTGAGLTYTCARDLKLVTHLSGVNWISFWKSKLLVWLEFVHVLNGLTLDLTFPYVS